MSIMFGAFFSHHFGWPVSAIVAHTWSKKWVKTNCDHLLMCGNYNQECLHHIWCPKELTYCTQKLKINKKPTKKQTISIEHMSSTNEPNTSSQWKDIVIISNNGTCTYFWFLNIKLREVLLNSKYTWLNRLCSSQVQFISSYLLHNSFVIIITD
jgi:hypothetical protein